jgi:hypothetical protein
VRGDLNAMRATLEAETRRRLVITDGPLPAREAAAINAAIGHEAARRLWLRWIARTADRANQDTFVKAMAEVRQCAESRDKIIARLLTDRPAASISELLSDVPPADSPPAGRGQQNAADAIVGELATDWGERVSDR